MSANSEQTEYLKSVFEQMHQESLQSHPTEPTSTTPTTTPTNTPTTTSVADGADLNNNNVPKIENDQERSAPSSSHFEVKRVRTFSDARFVGENNDNEEDDDEEEEILEGPRTKVMEQEIQEPSETQSITSTTTTTTQVEIHSTSESATKDDSFLTALKEILVKRDTFDPPSLQIVAEGTLDNTQTQDFNQQPKKKENEKAQKPSDGFIQELKSILMQNEREVDSNEEPTTNDDHVSQGSSLETIEKVKECNELDQKVNADAIQPSTLKEPLVQKAELNTTNAIESSQPPKTVEITESERIARSDWNLPIEAEVTLQDQIEKRSIESGIESTGDEEEARDSLPEPESTRPQYNRTISEAVTTSGDRVPLNRSVSATLANVTIGSFTEERQVGRSKVAELRKLWKDRVIQKK